MALEEYVKQVKEIWTNYTLDLIQYQNKCRLIRYAFRIYDDYVFLLNVFAVVGMIFSPNAVKT